MYEADVKVPTYIVEEENARSNSHQTLILMAFRHHGVNLRLNSFDSGRLFHLDFAKRNTEQRNYHFVRQSHIQQIIPAT